MRKSLLGSSCHGPCQVLSSPLSLSFQLVELQNFVLPVLILLTASDSSRLQLPSPKPARNLLSGSKEESQHGHYARGSDGAPPRQDLPRCQAHPSHRFVLHYLAQMGSLRQHLSREFSSLSRNSLASLSDEQADQLQIAYAYGLVGLVIGSTSRPWRTLTTHSPI